MNYIIAIFVIILSSYLFKKASGTLKINLINVNSFTFYSLLMFEFIGVTLVYLGFRDHYLIEKIKDESIINVTYWAMAYTMIILPIIMIIINRYVLKIKNLKEEYVKNINLEIEREGKTFEKRVFVLVLIGLIVCTIATVYVFYYIGYIPLLKYFDPNFTFSTFSTERINISRNFRGNQYIKNIFMITITPILSHIAYIYMRTTKEKKWTILFSILFILSIFIKTHDFSKAPIIYYICYFFVIEVMLGKTIKFKKVIPYILVVLLLVIFLYITVADYSGEFISISKGPISRILITQAGTMFLHFETFPNQIEFLKGHSFPPITKILLGRGEYNIRSGRELMKIYNSEAIENGTAGVMSTAFTGEAYANFGFWGVTIFPIIVSTILSMILGIYLKSKKTPLNIILYLESFIIFTSALQGGMVEFIYNINFIIVIMIIFATKIIASWDNERKIWNKK